VFNSAGQILGTLSIVGPAFRMTKKKLQIYGRRCVKQAAQLSPLIHWPEFLTGFRSEAALKNIFFKRAVCSGIRGEGGGGNLFYAGGGMYEN